VIPPRRGVPRAIGSDVLLLQRRLEWALKQPVGPVE
jgi:hypothetical protein